MNRAKNRATRQPINMPEYVGHNQRTTMLPLVFGTAPRPVASWFAARSNPASDRLTRLRPSNTASAVVEQCGTSFSRLPRHCRESTQSHRTWLCDSDYLGFLPSPYSKLIGSSRTGAPRHRSTQPGNTSQYTLWTQA